MKIDIQPKMPIRNGIIVGFYVIPQEISWEDARRKLYGNTEIEHASTLDLLDFEERYPKCLELTDAIFAIGTTIAVDANKTFVPYLCCTPVDGVTYLWPGERKLPKGSTFLVRHKKKKES